MTNQKWQRHKQGKAVEIHPGIKSADVYGRVNGIYPKHIECFFLSMLLQEVRGPHAFQEFRKGDDGIVPTTNHHNCQGGGCLKMTPTGMLPFKSQQPSSSLAMLFRPQSSVELSKEKILSDLPFQF